MRRELWAGGGIFFWELEQITILGTAKKVSPGAHWIVTSPSLVPARPLARIAKTSAQSLPSIFLELTFHNSAPDSTSLSLDDLSTPMARSWLRLRSVHDAFLQRSSLPLDALADLNLILSSLPPPWRTALISTSPAPTPAWTSISHPDDPISIFLGPDPNFPGPGTPPMRMLVLSFI